MSVIIGLIHSEWKMSKEEYFPPKFKFEISILAYFCLKAHKLFQILFKLAIGLELGEGKDRLKSFHPTCGNKSACWLSASTTTPYD